MNDIERIGFVVKPHAPEVGKILEDLVLYLEKKGKTCFFEEAAASILRKSGGITRDELPGRVNLVIVLGGDGTLLSIAYRAAQEDVPVMGVNLGSLGFLTEVPLEEVYHAIDSFLSGERRIVSPRQMLEVRHRNKMDYCLNDIVINKGALARMIQCVIWIDGREIARLRSDGLILATPTGSTAYSLAAGGPIIHPYIPAMILSPICPHTLSFRPMVISSESEVRIQLQAGSEEVYLTLDGQRGGRLDDEDSIHVRKSEHVLTLISSPKRNYYDLLHEKLGWG